MAKRHFLRDVNPEAISLVTKGANRFRFFLRKAAEAELDLDELVTMGGSRLVKAADWSAVYCVVAAPDAEEDPGMGAGDQSIPDVWLNEDEIRKAAHRFMKNGALVNKLHESLEPYGSLVENAVALDDFKVDGSTIKKGSWYIAIEPTDEGRQAIEADEFSGVSLQGTGTRVLVEKVFDEARHPRNPLTGEWIKVNALELQALFHLKQKGVIPPGISAKVKTSLAAKKLITPKKKGGYTLTADGKAMLPDLKKADDDPPPDCVECGPLLDRLEKEAFTKPGTANVSAADRKKLKGLLAHYAKKPHPFTACKRDQMKHGLSEAHANRRCAVLKDLIRGTTKWRGGKASATDSDTLGGMTGLREFFRKLGERSGMSDDELAALDTEIAKARTFGERMAQRELDDQLPEAMDVLRSTIWNAYYPAPDDDVDPEVIISTSLDEFKSWALELLGKVTVAKGDEATELRAELAKAFAPASDADGGTVEDEMGLTDEEREELDGLKERVEKLPDEIVKAIKEGKDGDDEPTAESVTKAVEDLGTEIKQRFEKVEADVKKLGAGSSSQPATVTKGGGNGNDDGDGDGDEGEEGEEAARLQKESREWAGII